MRAGEGRENQDLERAYDRSTNGWQTLFATIGQEGSVAAFIWPPGITSTHIIFRLGGAAGVFYPDDINVEPQG